MPKITAIERPKIFERFFLSDSKVFGNFVTKLYDFACSFFKKEEFCFISNIFFCMSSVIISSIFLISFIVAFYFFKDTPSKNNAIPKFLIVLS